MTAVYAEPVSNSAYLCLQSNQDIAWRPVSANGRFRKRYLSGHLPDAA